MMALAPAILLYGLCDLNRKFLNSFRKNTIPLISFIISVSLHPFWSYLLVVYLELKMTGIAIACVITNMTTFFMLKIFSKT